MREISLGMSFLLFMWPQTLDRERYKGGALLQAENDFGGAHCARERQGCELMPWQDNISMGTAVLA